MTGRLLPVACAFHTPLMVRAREPLARMAAEAARPALSRPVFSNLDAAAHPADLQAIAARLGDHVTSPVRFAEMIAAMHDAGARVFVEVGPGGVLTPLVGSILGDRPHLAVACDARGRPGLAGFLHALAQARRGRASRAARAADAQTGPRRSSISRASPRATVRLRRSLDMDGQRQPRPAAGRPGAPAAGPGLDSGDPRDLTRASSTRALRSRPH